MNRQFTSIFTGLIAGTTLAISAVPAQAFSIGSTGTANANGTLTFSQATTVDFNFLESRGMYQSKFGIYDAGTNALLSTLFAENSPGYDSGSSDANGDWLGTCGKTVTSCTNSFTFQVGKTYKFGLDSAPQGGMSMTESSGTFDEGMSSLPGISPGNPPGFISNATNYWRTTVGPSTLSNPILPSQYGQIDMTPYNFFVAINDSYQGDKDVQDFIVGAKVKTTPVPEPAALGGLGLVAGAMTMLRRRKNNRVS